MARRALVRRTSTHGGTPGREDRVLCYVSASESATWAIGCASYSQKTAHVPRARGLTGGVSWLPGGRPAGRPVRQGPALSLIPVPACDTERRAWREDRASCVTESATWAIRCTSYGQKTAHVIGRSPFWRPASTVSSRDDNWSS
jgi:hypothetical protein